MPKVSIIMPVYGVEKYVGKAIESIQNQTLTDFEFLIVDDGTKDRSGIICDEYAAKDARLKVIHKENGGAPSARNAAMEIATGDYYYFMDSDDWAEPTMLEDMVKIAEDTNAQLVVAGFYIDTYYTDTEYYTQTQQVDGVVYENQRAFREDAYRLFDKNLLYTPWNKLYSGVYLREHGIRFSDTFWDDFPFNLSVVRDVERVAVTATPYYHFMRARAESETAKYRADMYDKREEEHGWMEELFAYWKVDNEGTREFIARRYIERVIGCVENVANPACTLSTKEKVQEIGRIIADEKVRKLLKVMVPRSAYMKVMLIPVRMNSAFLTYLEGVVISKVRRGNVKTFAKLKAER